MGYAAFGLDVGIAAVIGHENNNSVVRDVVRLQVVQHVAQTLVHPFYHGRKLGLAGVQAHFFLVSVEEPRVFLDGRVGGVMRQIQVERLAPAYRFLQGLEGLAGKGLRQEDVLPVVFDHVLHGRHVPQLGFISEVIRSQITLR